MVHATRHGVRRRFPCRGAEAVFHGPDCLSDQEIPLLLDKVIDAPVVQVVQLPRLVVTVAVLGHAGDMPVVVNNRCLGLDSAEKLQRFRGCSSSLVVDFPVVVQRPIPMVLATKSFPSRAWIPRSSSSWCLRLSSSTTLGDSRCAAETGTWFYGAENCGRSAVAVHRWPSTSLTCCRGSSPWSRLFLPGGRCPCCAGLFAENCGNSAVAAHQQGLLLPVVAQWLSPIVQTVPRTTQIPQSLVDKVVAAPVVQVYQGVQVVDLS